MEESEKRNRYFPIGQWINAWNKIAENYDHLHILITGGEPFVYPSFTELIKELSRNFTVAFDTNLSCSKEELVNFAKNAVAPNVYMSFSFHPIYAELEIFLDKVIFLKESGFNNICVQYVTYPPQLGKMKYLQDKFVENNLYFIPLPFRGIYNGRKYPESFTDDEKGFIHGAVENLKTEHKMRVENQLTQVKSKGRLCKAGQVYARIDSDGEAFRCGHYTTNPDNVPNWPWSLGNIFKENFKLLDEPLPCEKNVCPCEFRWIVE